MKEELAILVKCLNGIQQWSVAWRSADGLLKMAVVDDEDFLLMGSNNCHQMSYYMFIVLKWKQTQFFTWTLQAAIKYDGKHARIEALKAIAW
jgi:hypothetical protein